MCTSLVIMYSNMGSVKEQSPPHSSAAIRKESRISTKEDTPSPVLEGYISVSDHKVRRRYTYPRLAVCQAASLCAALIVINDPRWHF